jgi:hypothetical protein
MVAGKTGLYLLGTFRCVSNAWLPIRAAVALPYQDLSQAVVDGDTPLAVIFGHAATDHQFPAFLVDIGKRQASQLRLA